MVPVSPQPPGQSVFQLRVQLEEVRPVVWRRLLVPGSVRMAKLHGMLQAALGWTDSHLHQFRVGDLIYGMHFDDYPEEKVDEKEVTVLTALREERRFFYDYDFGDSWTHEVVIEGLTWSRFGLTFAVCVDGQNACPPRGCRRLPWLWGVLGGHRRPDP